MRLALSQLSGAELGVLSLENQAHLRQSFACGHGNCRCRRFEFYVQQLGWEARCSCKHHVRDHRQLEGFPWPCSKVLPGKDKKPCPCKRFNISWVCTCGHPASEHETTWQRQTSKAAFAREWVAQGLRPECVAEAEEKRSRWQNQAASLVGSGMDLSAAKAAVKAKAQKMQISMCAEAKMMEAVEETLDGTRLPGPPAKLGYRQDSENREAVVNSKETLASRTMQTGPISSVEVKEAPNSSVCTRPAFCSKNSVKSPVHCEILCAFSNGRC